MNYFVLDSISASKREQKKKISEYAIIMMHQQVKRIIAMLLNSGIDITEEEIINIITNELKQEKTKAQVDGTEVKDKFRNAIDEYLERTQKFL